MRFSGSSHYLLGAAALVTMASASSVNADRVPLSAAPVPVPKSCQESVASRFLRPAFAAAPSQAGSVIASLRGGAVHEPSSSDDVDAILLRASAEGKLVALDFTATWCGPCQMIGPVFHDLSDRMDNVVFVKVDVDEIPDTAAKYSVSAMPTFVFIRSGEVVDRLMGANPAALEEKLQSLA